MERINVAIVGYGLSGKIFHEGILRSMEEFQVTCIMTNNPEAIKEIHKTSPGTLTVSRIEEILKHTDIQLVVIASPNVHHFMLAKLCLQAGKHVVVEKPFTVSTHEALLLLELQRETGLILSVFQNRRYDGDFLTVEQLINEEKMGRLVEFESHFDRFRNEFKMNAWREAALPGSGILYDLGAHLIDQALCLFGLPAEVYGDLSKQRRGDADDAFEIILYYAELKVTLKAGMLVNVPLPRFVLHGTKGSFIKYGLDIQEEALKSNLSPKDPSWGQEPSHRWGTLMTHQETKIPTLPGQYQLYYKNIYDAIVHHQPLAITPQDGFNVIRIIEAVMHSNELKKRIEIFH